MKTVILEGARTPVGKFGGALASLTASQLGGIAMKEAMKRANVQSEELDDVIFGNVLQAGQGQIPSRQAARTAGIPWNIKTETVNKVCASGLRSVTIADQIIRAGDEEVILAGGMESMSNVPMVDLKELNLDDAEDGDLIHVGEENADEIATGAVEVMAYWHIGIKNYVLC